MSSNERREQKCVDLSDYKRYWTEFSTQLKHKTTNMPECAIFT